MQNFRVDFENQKNAFSSLCNNPEMPRNKREEVTVMRYLAFTLCTH